MANKQRQILIHLHTSDNRAPSGSVLTQGELAISHNNLKDAALYTKINDQEVAKFITDIEIDARISAATDILNNIIYTYDEFSGLTESGSLIDAKLIRDIVVENEEVTSAALNDLNEKLIEDEEVTSAALNDLNDRVTAIELSGSSSTELEELSAHVLTNEYVFATAINDLNDRVIENEEICSAAFNDLNDRVTENEEITSAALNDLNDKIVEDEEVTSAALNDLNDRITELDIFDCGTYS